MKRHGTWYFSAFSTTSKQFVFSV